MTPSEGLGEIAAAIALVSGMVEDLRSLGEPFSLSPESYAGFRQAIDLLSLLMLIYEGGHNPRGLAWIADQDPVVANMIATLLNKAGQELP